MQTLRKKSGIRCSVVAMLIVACMGLASPASALTDVFDSTNLSSSTGNSIGVGSGAWMAFQFSALEDAHVQEIQIYTLPGSNSPQSFVNIGTSYGTGAVGSFARSSNRNSVPCGGLTCDELTFAGDAHLQAGTTYWLWIGSTSTVSSEFPLTPWFDGLPSTRPGLALQHILGLDDIKLSNGVISFDSSVHGYPWVRMIGRTRQGVDSAQPPVIQQFGKPATGSCDAIAPESLNWSGVASGGWGESWAHWMNGGNGGAVCTRTLVYSDNLGAWTVG